MEKVRKTECVVIVNDREYHLGGYGQDLGNGSFQSTCNVVARQGDSMKTTVLTFQVFLSDQRLAAEVALLSGQDRISELPGDYWFD